MSCTAENLESTDRIVKVLVLGERGHKYIVNEECPECGYDRAVEKYDSVACVGRIRCNACGNIIDQR